MKVDKTLQIDLETRRFYQDSSDDSDDEDDVDENHEKVDEEEVRRLYQQQYEHTVKQMNKLNPIPETVSIPPSNKKTRRAVRSIRDFLSYEWLRDGESVIRSKSDENTAVNLNGFTLFQNGTLKFQASNLTTGLYRCKAKYVDKSGKFVIGPIISTATVVEIASEFYK